ncbi:hypothetical protein EYF80_042146 [Liparis tanakae]|uniref:Uncharacterized protein n=1 Tax=Liparis tanakae TaxID=230148 RepID=A0A4Z2G271_9TELE|nr:hypothetical protein EYF80_042146 [Liparis tanakae]
MNSETQRAQRRYFPLCAQLDFARRISSDLLQCAVQPDSSREEGPVAPLPLTPGRNQPVAEGAVCDEQTLKSRMWGLESDVRALEPGFSSVGDVKLEAIAAGTSVLRSVTRRQLVESSPTRPFRTTLDSKGRNSGEIRCSVTSGDMLFMLSTARPVVFPQEDNEADSQLGNSTVMVVSQNNGDVEGFLGELFMHVEGKTICGGMWEERIEPSCSQRPGFPSPPLPRQRFEEINTLALAAIQAED